MATSQASKALPAPNQSHLWLGEGSPSSCEPGAQGGGLWGCYPRTSRSWLLLSQGSYSGMRGDGRHKPGGEAQGGVEGSWTWCGERDADGRSPPGSPTTTCRTCTSAPRPACCCWLCSVPLSLCCGGSSATRTSKCSRVPGSADSHPVGFSLLSLGAPASKAWGFPSVGLHTTAATCRVPFHVGLAQSPYPDRNLDKGSVGPSPRAWSGPEPLFVTHILACGLRQHLMPGCHLSPTPVVIGSPVFSCSEFPRGSYAYSPPSRQGPGATALRTACLSPPGSWSSLTPAAQPEHSWLPCCLAC